MPTQIASLHTLRYLGFDQLTSVFLWHSWNHLPSALRAKSFLDLATSYVERIAAKCNRLLLAGKIADPADVFESLGVTVEFGKGVLKGANQCSGSNETLAVMIVTEMKRLFIELERIRKRSEKRVIGDEHAGDESRGNGKHPNSGVDIASSRKTTASRHKRRGTNTVVMKSLGKGL